MSLEYQILVAMALDVLIGDPRWFPHPVRLMGALALRLEGPARRLTRYSVISGVLLVVIVVGLAVAVTWSLVSWARWVDPLFGDLVSIFFLYTGIAMRDMVRHSADVYRALIGGSLLEAREKVGMICGRDTDQMDDEGVTRAAVESVAENTVDGVTAPLFYAVIAGPVGIMAYKAINTLDSTFGYKNVSYRELGWAAARLDDIVNFLPARLTAIIVPLSARILGERASTAFWALLRDGGKHPSPNAGQTEAAVAGALGIQLGGVSFYGGQISDKPTLGDPLETPAPGHILRANALLVITSGIFLVLMLAARALVLTIVGDFFVQI